ncbi:helix-turn-helix domain-containing protein [Actinomadura atramentaria]|uniref:helix-turn-helix domain-containing protein n=1 Tax=Actinomadura atramentaria TaxID=1990 RepID=UPI003B836AE1
MAAASLDRPAATAGTALTEPERRLAALVAAGATNRETAQRLFLSVKTVEATLSRIYRKLNVRSRTELAGVLGREEARLTAGAPAPAVGRPRSSGTRRSR